MSMVPTSFVCAFVQGDSFKKIHVKSSNECSGLVFFVFVENEGLKEPVLLFVQLVALLVELRHPPLTRKRNNPPQ